MKVDKELKADGDDTPPTPGAVSIDGVISAADDARISPLDAAVLHGDAFFETLRVRHGSAVMLGPHLDRLENSVVSAGYRNVPDRPTLMSWIDDAVAATGLNDAALRVTISRGARPRLLGSRPSDATCLIYVLPLPPRAVAEPPSPMSVKSFDCPGYRFPRKSASYQRNVELYEAARAAGFDEALIFDGETVVEGSGTNVLAIVDERLLTPPLRRCLPGITRAALLAAAPSCGLAPVERELDMSELVAADAVLLANSLVGIREVGKIDKREIAPDRAKQAVERLRQGLNEIEESS